MKIKLTDFENVLVAAFTMGLAAKILQIQGHVSPDNPFKVNTPQWGQWNKGSASGNEVELIGDNNEQPVLQKK